MLSMFALELAMRNKTPLRVKGSALRWVAIDYDATLSSDNESILLECLAAPDKKRAASPMDVELAY